MDRLKAVLTPEDIPAELRDTPVARLLCYHNMGMVPGELRKAELLISMCMDNRNQLHIPNNFAFILRSGGGNLRHNEFKVSYAVSVGGVKYIALIGHSNCGMVNLHEKKDAFISGLVDNAGWDREFAEDHFNQFSPIFEIGNEIDFLLSESARLRGRYPRINVVPLYYKIEDHKLYLVNEK
ncbi:carbonic anhydrase [Xiashengella succiniciproducens]|jgi:carbonic anhydrase|uniref:Carbonic anhydrase n=1 Tax=Xiashengella succiniciproducens TaxID=2949635 RepID=A0A9J6ZRK5_9BACT|nr:carbonic anhydrase [Alkaliflexus sp. Ai-910]URW80580.1 carbonic anhydrase [Alkaliflexus sp. Ai-910]